MKIIDWQCHFTGHQLSTWRELERLNPEPVIHIVARLTSEQRSQQGWGPPDINNMDVIRLNKRGWFSQGLQILRENGDAIHVFGGFWADRRFLPLIVFAVLHGVKVAVMNEAYATEPVGYLSNSQLWVNRIKVILRPMLYRGLAISLRFVSRKNRLCVLALSKRAEAQFLKAGFSPGQVFPFGYFVPKLELSTSPKQLRSGPVRLIFVGSLLERKGIDLAVRAIETLASEGIPVTLDVYGHGDAGRYIPPVAKAVAYRGNIPFGEAQRVIADYDALLLPSRHDGWGVVVNEALLQGVPVIVSSHVGAKCLVEASRAGMVFESCNLKSLKKNISKFVINETMQLDMQHRTRKIGKSITPENAARYMKDVLEFYFAGMGDRPRWFVCNPLSIK